MRFTVAELDAMPVGTVLFTQHCESVGSDVVMKGNSAQWFQLNGSGDRTGLQTGFRALPLILEMDFTHRADPQPITQPTPDAGAGEEQEHG